MLILARRIGESIMIGDAVEVSVVDIKGDQVKLGIRAPTQVKVYRAEVYAAIQAENRAAAAAPGTLPRLEGLLPPRGPGGEAPLPPRGPGGDAPPSRGTGGDAPPSRGTGGDAPPARDLPPTERRPGR